MSFESNLWAINNPAVARMARARLAAVEQILAPLDVKPEVMATVRRYFTLTAPPFPNWPAVPHIYEATALFSPRWEQINKLADALIESGVVS